LSGSPDDIRFVGLTRHVRLNAPRPGGPRLPTSRWRERPSRWTTPATGRRRRRSEGWCC